MSNCLSCKEAVSSGDSFVLRICRHIFCYKCLYNYMKTKIGCKIKCPLQSCNKNISDKIIRQCLSNAHIDYYEQMSISKSTYKARKCLTETCPFIIVIDDDNAVFHCSYCDQPNCLKCKKRHYPHQCGGPDRNEDDINAAANESMKRHRRKALEDQFKDENYIPNSDGFECEICCCFILPREGIVIRNCFHNFCKSCFEKALQNVGFITNLTCPTCKMDVNNQEVIKAIGLPKLIEMNCKVAAPKMFCCKHPDCDGMWDNSQTCKGSYNCPKCKHSNCLDCEDMHEKLSCAEFRQTKRYKDAQKVKKKLQSGPMIKCFCGRMLIQKGGCGALHCDSCGIHVCAFTGKKVGNNGPDTCGCTITNPCHPDCKYGCFPE